MNAASFSRWVVAGAVLLSARCLLAQAVPLVGITNAPAFETAASSNAQYAIRQRLYPVMVEGVESPFDVTNSDPAALTYDWADTNAGRGPPAGPIRPPMNNPPVEPVGSRFEHLPLIEFTNFGHMAGSTVQSTNQQWEEGLPDLEVAADFAPATSWDQLETNVTESVENPVPFEVSATNAESFNRGSLYFPEDGF
jgi:hypothetical protein